MKSCEHCSHDQQIEHLHKGIEKAFERIEQLETLHAKEMKDAEFVLDILAKRTGILLEDMQDMAKWRKSIKILTDQSKKPNKCPVCNGKGSLNNFKPIHAGVNMICMLCHSCEGKGIVWG